MKRIQLFGASLLLICALCTPSLAGVAIVGKDGNPPPNHSSPAVAETVGASDQSISETLLLELKDGIVFLFGAILAD